jgi:predicted nucleotidyltransferase
MSRSATLDRILRELSASYGAHTVLLYGSRADGTAGVSSDYDIAAFGEVAAPIRIARSEAGEYLDVFVYPDVVLLNPSEEYLPLRGSKVLAQRGSQVESFLHGLEEVFRAGPQLLRPDEIAARRIWAHKMVARMERRDPEGNYRRTWLLQALLEDYFQIRGLWYEGPKKALRWLAQFEPDVYSAFCVALEPGASEAAIRSLVKLAVGEPDA